MDLSRLGLLGIWATSWLVACSGRGDLNDVVRKAPPSSSLPDKGALPAPAGTAPSCSIYDGMMAALGELTADCRGKIDPADYVIAADGRLTTNFDSCPADPTNPVRLLRIQQLLSAQRASDLPDVVRCTAGRFQSLKAKFAERNIRQCPSWSNKHVLNPAKTPDDLRPTSVNIDQLALLLPAMEENREVALSAPWVPAPELSALEIKSTYTLTQTTGDQSCGTAVECAAACAEVFPSFVIPRMPGTISTGDPNQTIFVDPASWWSEQTYGPGLDPYNINLVFYHQMGFSMEKYGALQRWNPCNLAVADPRSSAPLIAPAVPASCVSEKCNFYAGGSVSNPSYIKTKLQKWCIDYKDPTTCLSYCGTKPPPPAL